MSTDYIYAVGVLCPIENIEAANLVAFQLTGNPADISTFSADQTLVRDGQHYAYAHGVFRTETFVKLPELADQLGGICFETSGDFWEQVEAMGFEVVEE